MTSRTLGVQSVLRDLPEPVVVCFSLVTQLGDVWFLVGVATLVYWVGPRLPRVGETIDRRRAAVVLGTVLAALVVVTAGKELFALPRPPGASEAPQTELVPTALWPLYEWFATGSGYGFPSGHAIGSTAAFGGLAWAVRTGRPRARITAAIGLVAVVSASRLVLGLHYLVDVLAGVGLGVVVLAVAIALQDPGRVFAVGASVGAVGLAVVGPITDLVLLAGATAGATLGWMAFADRLVGSTTKRAAVLTVTLGVAVVGPLFVLGETLHVPVIVAGPAALVGGLALVAMPLVGERAAKKSV